MLKVVGGNSSQLDHLIVLDGSMEKSSLLLRLQCRERISMPQRQTDD